MFRKICIWIFASVMATTIASGSSADANSLVKCFSTYLLQIGIRADQTFALCEIQTTFRSRLLFRYSLWAPRFLELIAGPFPYC